MKKTALWMALLLGTVGGVTVGCQEEDTGDKIEDAIDDTADAVGDAAEDTADAVEDTVDRD